MPPASPRLSAAALILAWITLAGAFLAMAELDIPADPVLGFLGLYHLAFLGWVLAALTAWFSPPRGRVAITSILAGGLLLRIFAWSVPVIMETDRHRYLWDGFVTRHGFNPYEFAPSEVLAAVDASIEGLPLDNGDLELRDPASRSRLEALTGTLLGAPAGAAVLAHLREVNHPTVPSCYPPVAQLGFAACAHLLPGDEWLWKAFVTGVDALICLLILALLVQLGREPAWVIFYAWNPLPIKEYCNTGHYDPLATVFVLAGVLLLMRRRAVLGGAALGVGVAAKLYPLVLLPVLWRRLRGRGIGAALALMAVAWAPFLGLGPRILDGLLAFAKDWEFNSSCFGLVFWVLDRPWMPRAKLSLLLEYGGGGDFLLQLDLEPFFYARLVTGLGLLVLLALLARWPDDEDWTVPGRAFAAVAGIFLLAPVADPWYLAWVLPWATLFPSLAIMLLSGTVANYYLYFLEWSYLWWSRPLEYVPAGAILVYEVGAFLRRHPDFPWWRPGAAADD